MPRIVTLQPLLVVAGPGSGKTYGMVSEIAKAIRLLDPSRVLAAITYTNASAESIRKQLVQVSALAPNVFIGTNHSFLIRFILRPFGSLFDQTPSDCLFMDFDLEALVKRRIGKSKKVTRQEEIQIRRHIEANLVKTGRVPFDQVAVVSAKLVQNKRVRSAVANRLQYLFVDEFQDVDTTQLTIIDEIRKAGKTSIYVVGDPEQYISGYTYKLRAIPPPEFARIPFFRFAEKSKQDTQDLNRRSCLEIVTFTNQLHSEIDQVPCRGSLPYGGVYFISETKLDDIVASFRRVVEVLDSKYKIPPVRLHLSFENKTFRDHAEKHGLVPISNESPGRRTLLADSLSLIPLVVGQSQEEIRQSCNLDLISIRKVGIQLLKNISSGNVTNTEDLRSFVRAALALPVDNNNCVRADDAIRRLQHALTHGASDQIRDRFASIHKAKGLQAEAVLVVAENSSRLSKWLITDKKQRQSDKNDECRIGFVGFSRAKDILCIACLQEASPTLVTQLKGLGVKVVGSKPALQDRSLFPLLFEQ